jgi:hypothetical protein
MFRPATPQTGQPFTLAAAISLHGKPGLDRDAGPKRVKGIEPSSLAWKAIALPLSYTREAPRIVSLWDCLAYQVTRLLSQRFAIKSAFREAWFAG